MTNDNPRSETNRASSADVSRSTPNATVTPLREQGCEAVYPSNRQQSVQQSMAEAAVTHQKAELESLIHELSEIYRQMLDLEALGLQKAAHIHPTYLQSARNLFHYLALRRREMRPIQERLSALGLSSLGRTESHVLTSVNKVLEALHR